MKSQGMVVFMTKVKLKPSFEDCRICIDFMLSGKIPDCRRCWRISNVFELVGVEKGFWWGNYAIIKKNGEIYKVPYYRVEIISEDKNDED